ncbi:MAG: tyrosine-type recombinase/integrase [Desulfobacterales bacterium]|nr:MAG: tyrosine-type recombinase/integrase [Desulfobacterales bacterium]
MKKLLSDKPRDLTLFAIGINTNLRASDLKHLKVSQVRHLKPAKGENEIEVVEKKTGKPRRIALNKTCIEAIRNLLNSNSYEDSDYLFHSQRREVLTVPSVIRLVKSWCRAINLKGNYGSHTLRKTWGYHQRVTFGVDLPRLMVNFPQKSRHGQAQSFTFCFSYSAGQRYPSVECLLCRL